MGIIDHIIGLIETRLELIKIEAKEDASHILARLLVIMLLGLFLFFTWFFAALGIGMLLNALLDSRYVGVLLVALLHLIIFALIYLLRDSMGIKNLIRRILDSIIETKE